MIFGNSILHLSNVYPKTCGGVGKTTLDKSVSNKNDCVSKISPKRSLNTKSNVPVSYFAYKTMSDDGMVVEVNAVARSSSVYHPVNVYPSFVGEGKALKSSPNPNISGSIFVPPLTTNVML